MCIHNKEERMSCMTEISSVDLGFIMKMEHALIKSLKMTYITIQTGNLYCGWMIRSNIHQIVRITGLNYICCM